MHIMQRVALRLAAIVFALGAAIFPALSAQNYPTRPIKVLVSTAPGGLFDHPAARARPEDHRSDRPARHHREQDRRQRRGRRRRVREVAATDGYTLMGAFHGVNAILPHMTTLTFDPREFEPIVHFLCGADNSGGASVAAGQVGARS